MKMARNVRRKPQVDHVIQELAQRLREQFGDRIRKIILYGSRARGTAEPDSDYDLIVLVDKEGPELREGIGKVEDDIAFDHDAVFAVFVYEEAYFDQKKYEPLFTNVRREGITL